MNDAPLSDVTLECDVCGSPILPGTGAKCDECQAPLCCETCEREHMCAELENQA